MRVQAIVDAISARQEEVGPAIVNELLAVLMTAREHFADLEEWTIFLAVVSKSSVLARDVDAPSRPPPPGAGTNVRSLADSCELPRETVRRKVRKLMDRGYVAARDDRLLATEQAKAALQPLTQQVYRSAARVRLMIDKAMAEGAGQPPP
ncbi:hypothetical protein [Phenylobacterium sp.]|uniref:hypothetical protein n=1 Tax=Phenylobacterium sp. TaxID=1871053 RepID=UPI002811B8E3|nr:hypothetical protein [Phenylobacterium sp.]